MPQPVPSDVHVNRPLTNVSVAVIQDETNFVAADVFPPVPTTKQGDVYYTYEHAYWDRDEMQLRGPSEESAGSGYTVNADNSFFCPVYAMHKDIPDQVRGNSDVPLNPDREATRYVTLKGLIKREKLFATAYMAGSKWTRDYDGVVSSPSTNEVLQWNDASSTPIEDVWDAKQDVLERTGFEPNVLCIGYPVYKTLVNHADFVDRVKYGQTSGGPAMIDTGELAAIFKVAKVVVMKAKENVSLEGATASGSFIGGKKALLVYAPPAPGLMTPSGGYIFSWTGYLGAGPQGNRISRFRMEHLKSDRVEIEIAFAMKLISADLGAFWDTIVA